MKRKLALFLTLVLCAAIYATESELPRIAVYVTGDVGANEKSALGTRMLSTLVNSGRWVGIERSSAFIAEIEREQETQRSGAVDDSQISALGRRFGVKYVCVADITPAFGAFQVSARIINVETAEVVYIGDAHSSLQTMDDLTQVSNEVVNNMFRGQVSVTPPPKVTITPPQVAPATEQQPAPTGISASPQERAAKEKSGSSLRTTLRWSSAALAGVGLIGGLILDGEVSSEYDRYKEESSNGNVQGVISARENAENNITGRNAFYTLGIIGLAGFSLTFVF